jgi:hypothetical protein
MTDYPLVFCLSLLMNVVITLGSSDCYKRWIGKATSEEETNDDATRKDSWKQLLQKYLAVYLLATLSDWLQGPYLYALYSDYGYSQHDIAVLFVAGFGSSMVFGSFIGGMADWGGRRAFVLVYSVVYALSCITKHFKDFKLLIVGRMLAGVATSLLFSVFEAWLIRAHADNNLQQWLGKSFSWAAYANSVIAIGAGLVADKAAGSSEMRVVSGNFHIGGYLAPFDLSFLVLLICGGAAVCLWDENLGEEQHDDALQAPKWHDGLKNAWFAATRNTDVLLCGIISSLFEGSMYVFVFIFSIFMVNCMAGSSLYSMFAHYEMLPVIVLAASAVAMLLIAALPGSTHKFLAMNVFEVCVGVYWPMMGILKGAIVPEDKRAAIYNLYRVPLNLIVLFSLLGGLTSTQSFWLNFGMLSVATGLMLVLMKRRSKDACRENEPDTEGYRLVVEQEVWAPPL